MLLGEVIDFCGTVSGTIIGSSAVQRVEDIQQ